jgi:UDP-N-acetylmuramoyl-L-alanyl-D-glutamate--2,6-diaminopimelate ligase
MSTSFRNDFPGESRTPTDPLSLRGFLREAVFVGAEDILVRRCASRAALCQPGDVFIPHYSALGDEHDQVEEAIRRGAVAVVSERLLPVAVPQCLVDNTCEVYGRVCQALVGNPSQRMLTIGVVGTHAKTTTALFVAAMLKRLGGAVAYYTSLGASDSTACDRTATRPPAARKLAKWMEQCDLAGAPAMLIELTPNMLRQQVAAGVEFDVLILTGLRPSQLRGNPSQSELTTLLTDLSGHLKPHGMMLVNADDALAATWAKDSGVDYVDYGLDAAQLVRAKRLGRYGSEQQLLTMCGNTLMPLTLKMPGDHVARGALAAVAIAWMFDFSVPEAIAGIESLTTIPGRMQRIAQAVEVPVLIDAAQSPDRLAVALHALRQHQLGPTTVVMDLGPRLDPQWRHRLGEVLDKGAERVVLSASDFSAETAQSIAMDVLGGIRSPGRVQVIPDRTTAIRWAVDHTEVGAILLAGCGVDCWTDRAGNAVTDEQIAQQAVARKNSIVKLPALSIFPPAESATFFTH